MTETAIVKKYAVGRIYFYAEGDPKYKKEAEKALETPGVCDIKPVIWKEGFEEAMRKKGIPEEFIKGYLENITAENEAYLQDNSRW